MSPGSPTHPRVVQWVEALRSGEYRQGRLVLTRYTPTRRDCCMGVGCDIARIPKVEAVIDYDLVQYGRTRQTTVPPVEFALWLGFTPPEGWTGTRVNLTAGGSSLDVLNDQYGWAFDRIADSIEQHGVEVVWL